MKKLLFGIGSALLLFCGVAMAQTVKKETKKEVKKDAKKEIIIEENSSGKKEKMVIVINGDKVTINGKPAEEYKGKKRIVIDDDISINGDVVHIPRHGSMYFHGFDEMENNRAMLGVMTEEDDKGAKVKEVVKGSAAEKAGLKSGDIITKINEDKIEDHGDLVETIGDLKPADVADVTFLRDGKEQKIKATLDKNKTPKAMTWNWNGDDFEPNFDFHMSPPVAMATPRPHRAPHAYSYDNDMWVFRSDRPKYGMSIEDYADGDGVKITEVETESSAGKAGLKKDDIITEVDGKPIKGTDELKEALADTKDKTALSMKVLRNGAAETISVKVPKYIKKAEL